MREVGLELEWEINTDKSKNECGSEKYVDDLETTVVNDDGATEGKVKCEDSETRS
jgi:hypothetical protein